MISKFEVFENKKMDTFYLTESMITEWLKKNESWDDGDKSYLGGSDFWSQWLFKHYDELPLDEAIESVYLTWKSEQHRLTLKYDILLSFYPSKTLSCDLLGWR